MRHVIAILLSVLAFALSAGTGIVAEVDVVVAGGTSYGVAAAVAAAKEGKRVMLVAPRPALGEDLAGTLRLAPGEKPLQVKRRLDRELLDAGVAFRCWLQPCDIACDEKGNVTGLWVAGRDGRSLVKAKEVVDATPLANLARRAGVLPGLEGGDLTFVRHVVSGSKPVAEGLAVTKLWDVGTVEAADDHMSPQLKSAPNSPRTVEASLWRCERTFSLKDLSARTLADVEQRMRDATWTRDQADGADFCYLKDPPEGCGRAHRIAKVVRPPAAPQVLAETDVLVVGGGTTGAPVAIAAGRKGVKTLCVEYSGRLGGIATDGGIGRYCNGLRRGFTSELDTEVAKVGSFYGVCKAEWLRREGRRHGVEYWLTAQATGAIVENGRLAGVFVAMPDGTYGIVRAKVTVDATGSAQIAASAGERTEFLADVELSVQGAGSAPRVLGRSLLNTDAFFIDDTDPEDLTYEWLRARTSFGERPWDQMSVVSSRERRRLHGAFYVTPQDVIAERNYPDLIGLASSNFDTHGQTVDPEFFIEIPHRKQNIIARLPYRALLPERTEGLLVVGLGMSAHRDAMPVLRMQADLQNNGYAAGLAAAQAVRSGTELRAIDIRELQRELVAKGILTEAELAAPEGLPLSDAELAEAVAALGNGYTGLARVLSDVPRACPLLELAYANAADGSPERLVYAHVLGILGSASGTKEVVRALDAQDWDEGWNYRGMGQFGSSVSRVDSLVHALGCPANADDEAALEAVRRKAAALTPSSHYSHYRAVAWAVERIGTRKLIPDLLRLLALKGVRGHALRPSALPRISGYDQDERTHVGVANEERSACLRELALVRALYALGDSDGLAEGVLRAYASDPRRVYATYAKRVLARRETCRRTEPGAVQAAVDRVAAAGGGRVIVPRGEYPIMQLELRSGVTLELAEGARLFADTNALPAAALIVTHGAKGVAIVGAGEIDGCGALSTPYRNNRKGRWKLMVFQDTKDIRIEGVTLRGAASWTCYLQRCDGVLVRGVKLDAHANYNNDGFDIEASNVLIEDCDIDCEDDAICGKIHDPAFVSENVEVRNCRLASNCNFVKLGTASFGTFRDWRVHDVELHPCRVAPFEDLRWRDRGIPGVTEEVTGLAGIALEAVDGGQIEDIRVWNVKMSGGVQTPFLLRVAARHGEPKPWHLRNVTIENVTGVSASWIASSVTGVPGRRLGGGIAFRNIDLVLKGGIEGDTWKAPVPECETVYPENRMFGTPLPARGFYVRHADGIRFENVRLRVAGADPRPPFVRDDANDLIFDTITTEGK